MDSEKVFSLREELDDLLDIQHRILKIKDLQAELFVQKVGKVLKTLEKEGTPNFPEQSVEEILALALPIDDFINRPAAAGLRIVRSHVGYIMSSCYSCEEILTIEVPYIVEQIGLIENKLEKFLDETDFYDVWENLRNSEALLPSRVVVRDLLQASQELKEAINFFYEVATESAALCQYLKFLITFLETLQCDSSHELVEGIRVVVKTALDAVKCPAKDRLSSQMGMFEEDVLLVRDLDCSASDIMIRYFHDAMKHSDEAVITWLDSAFINMKENCIEKQARGFFDGKNGMRLVLLDTLGKLHSFKGEIDMIRKARRRDCLLPCNPSFGSLQLFSHFSHLPKERKRGRNS